jgi:hypothetical protein
MNPLLKSAIYLPGISSIMKALLTLTINDDPSADCPLQGNGDRYWVGQQLHYAPIVIRPNTSQEACPDMRASPPDFDTCTVPLVMWSRWPFNIVEAFGNVYARLHRAVSGGDVSKGLLPVLATPHGLKAPR